MLMVVFGAGASYDSAPSVPPGRGEVFHAPAGNRPPLADGLFSARDLFAPILERFPRAQDVVSRLRHLQPGETVENVMEVLRAEADRDPRRLRQLAALQYYLQTGIGECESSWDRLAARGVTNYKTLLDLIEHLRNPDEKVCLVSFNYDTMLEAALPTVGVTIRAIEDYVASPVYKVAKLHGSVNWGHEVEAPVENVAAVPDEQLMNEMIDRATELKFTDRYWVANQRPMVRLGQRILFPAIAIPLARKQSYECPTTHVDVLRECLPQVDRLLVIGWRATDQPFLQIMHDQGRQNLGGVVVAGGREAGTEVIANLTKGLDRPGTFRASAGGFTDFMVQHEAEAFLREALSD